MILPRSLRCAPPSWERDVDVVVIGSGAAGLAAALAARPVRSVLVVTKDRLAAGSTAWAQGGLAGVLDPEDSFEDHVSDTLVAGAGLCDETVVRELVAEAPTSIRYLMRLGAAFDTDGGADISLTREGGHSHQRIVHSGGDRSGAEVQRTLDESALGAGVEVMEHAFALDLVTGQRTDGRIQVAGVRVALCDRSGGCTSVGTITARAVVLASGGFGQVFASTSNPPAVTGDGLAIALRAGLPLCDLEFMQFHPTVLWTGPDATGQQALVSEAVRGEGAVLVDAEGRSIMAGVHPLADLAPRDVVAAAITTTLLERPQLDHVWLDATGLGTRFHTRFPTITNACARIGIDPAVDLIPVAPASHYACGGVRAGLDGSTSRPGLFAVGEVTCTGVHGANRLASNSLTEGIVSGTRLGRDLAWELPERVGVDGPTEATEAAEAGVLIDPTALAAVRRSMSRHVGVLRSATSLGEAMAAIESSLADATGEVVANRAAWEATNLVSVAAAMVTAALQRTESRGCHRRLDHLQPDEAWRAHLEVTMDRSGAVQTKVVPV